MVRGMFDTTGQWAHWKLAMVRGVFDPTGQGSVDPQDPVSHSFANNVPSYHTMESVLVL